jgi:hypothetical protein
MLFNAHSAPPVQPFGMLPVTRGLLAGEPVSHQGVAEYDLDIHA